MASSRNVTARVRRLRTGILAMLASVLVVLGVLGLYAAWQPVPDDPEAGRHYTELPGLEAPRDGEVVVYEYFSYLCEHCRNFEPQVSEWSRELPAGVRLERVPAPFSATLRRLAAAYYAAAELGHAEAMHGRIFDAIHDRNADLTRRDAMAAFMAEHGVDGDRFRRTLRAPAVRQQLADAEQLLQSHRIMSVPALVVDSRYRIDAGQLSRRQMLAVADRLIDQELAARNTDR